MTTDEILNCFETPILHAGASSEAVSDVEQLVGKKLPKSYVDLMRRTNGVEGFVGAVSYVMLWPLEQLAELNEGYGVRELATGLWLFGSNGDDTGYAFDTRDASMPVKEVLFIGLGYEEAKTAGENFEKFFNQMSGKNR